MWISMALAIIVMVGIGCHARTITLTDANFQTEVGLQPSFIMFSASWCGHCKKTKPEWEMLSEAFAETDDVLIGMIDADENKKIAEQFEIRGFPTIKYFAGDNEKPIDYEGEREVGEFTRFVNRQTGLKIKVKTPEKVPDLSGVEFEKSLEDPDLNHFVVFYASWCGHCKTLLPKLPAVQKAFVGDKSIAIVTVDVDKYREIGEKYKIEGYPTIKLFLANNRDGIAYDGSGREPDDIVEFINDKVGTHRTISGDFTTSAWPSVEIQNLVIAFNQPNSDKKAICAKVEKEASSASGKYAKFAQFYPRMMKKIVEKGADYLKTETHRLKNLLKTPMGDDTKVNVLFRLNILQQLKGDDFTSSEKVEL